MMIMHRQPTEVHHACGRSSSEVQRISAVRGLESMHAFFALPAQANCVAIETEKIVQKIAVSQPVSDRDL